MSLWDQYSNVVRDLVQQHSDLFMRIVPYYTLIFQPHNTKTSPYQYPLSFFNLPPFPLILNSPGPRHSNQTMYTVYVPLIS